MSDSRYGIYYAPAPESDLWQFGSRWLGRDAATGVTLDRVNLTGVDDLVLEEITASPRFYGFHATLKPPFRLAGGYRLQQLCEAIDEFVNGRAHFPLPRLEPVVMSGFLALKPSTPCARLDALASDSVVQFDRFRRYATPAERDKRIGVGLSPNQMMMLDRWGYPYVMQEFRFHMTLSGALSQPMGAGLIERLSTRILELQNRPLMVDAITLFQQQDSETPFRILKRFPFNRESRGGER